MYKLIDPFNIQLQAKLDFLYMNHSSDSRIIMICLEIKMGCKTVPTYLKLVYDF